MSRNRIDCFSFPPSDNERVDPAQKLTTQGTEPRNENTDVAIVESILGQGCSLGASIAIPEEETLLLSGDDTNETSRELLPISVYSEH